MTMTKNEQIVTEIIFLLKRYQFWSTGMHLTCEGRVYTGKDFDHLEKSPYDDTTYIRNYDERDKRNMEFLQKEYGIGKDSFVMEIAGRPLEDGQFIVNKYDMQMYELPYEVKLTMMAHYLECQPDEVFDVLSLATIWDSMLVDDSYLEFYEEYFEANMLDFTDHREKRLHEWINEPEIIDRLFSDYLDELDHSIISEMILDEIKHVADKNGLEIKVYEDDLIICSREVNDHRE